MIPEQAPFDSVQRARLAELLSGMDERQRYWLSGFLAAPLGGVVTSAPVAGPELLVLYGTESGNSEQLADRAVKAAKKRGFKATMKNMSEAKLAALPKVPNLLVVVSTWGDGEPPETAAAFYKELMAADVNLGSTKFSVCALGDTSYEKFCQTGKDVDAKLEALGASRVFARQDCDVDFEEPFESWLAGALGAFGPVGAVATSAVATSFAPVEAYGKKNPFPAELLDSALLNGKGSSKETWHFELSLAGSGLAYEPGDALAVQPVNAPDVVGAVLAAAKADGAAVLEGKTLFDALREDYDITSLSRAVLTKLAAATSSAELQSLLADDAKEKLKQYIEGRQIADALEDFAPNGLDGKALTGILRKLPVRLYSIASSPLAHPDEVHLTVGAVRYQSQGKARKGVCSTYLADLVKPGDPVRVFVQPNKNFRLPASGDTPVIMVGPGTGIAPFRSFVEHRDATGAKGRNWLFMGDQHYLYDFLYQLEWQDYLKSGALTRLDVAFSRDQPEKIYVQDKLRERAKEVYAWLQDGAHFYVCGDASRMAKDVHEALVAIIQGEGGLSVEQAEEYLEQLKKSGRYQRDVY